MKLFRKLCQGFIFIKRLFLNLGKCLARTFIVTDYKVIPHYYDSLKEVLSLTHEMYNDVP